VEGSTIVKITVSGGYKPAIINVASGKLINIIFTRTDPTDCLEEVSVPDLKIKKTLPLNIPVTIPVIFNKPGEYPFHCGMNMFHGKFIAK
jgi:plastocyanin domain-containing protein